MARVKVTHEWQDGDRLTVEVSCAESYPDAVDQARAQARRLWSEVLGMTVDTLASDDADETE